MALAVLPLVERIFNRYSNITLLDYTDFNNPLLRRLQIEAPGTYHHSVMVSYLAEAAAVAVNANPMVCRVGSLYHDIGKIQKPEFFTENQGGGKNAHDEKNPSMSALIIKNHIREGAEIAKIAKLPKQIIDAIDQHHGKSIVSYFYYKAQEMAKANGIKDPLQALRDAGIEESTYRYEGTLPQTVENAIIMIGRLVRGGVEVAQTHHTARNRGKGKLDNPLENDRRAARRMPDYRKTAFENQEQHRSDNAEHAPHESRLHQRQAMNQKYPIKEIVKLFANPEISGNADAEISGNRKPRKGEADRPDFPRQQKIRPRSGPPQRRARFSCPANYDGALPEGAAIVRVDDRR